MSEKLKYEKAKHIAKGGFYAPTGLALAKLGRVIAARIAEDDGREYIAEGSDVVALKPEFVEAVCAVVESLVTPGEQVPR